MRVCFIAHSNSPWTPYYGRFLQSRGHEVHIISFHPEPINGLTVHYVGSSHADGRLPKWIYLWRVPRVRRLLKRIRPDVVMATYFQSNGLIGALTKGSPLIVSTRGADHHFHLPFGLGQRLVRWVASRADLLHASSPELSEGLSAMGVPADKFVVIPVGTDPREFHPRVGPRPPGLPRLICTRKHDPLYDNETLVRALALARDQGFQFECRFVGTGSTLHKSRALAEELRLGDCVTFLGACHHNQVAEHLRWADLYLSATKSDGAASSLFEAMSSNIFPIVTDVRANRDWIEHGRTGHLFPVGDSAACAVGIRWAWNNPEIRAAAGVTNRDLIVRHLDRQQLLIQLEQLLMRVAAMKR